MVTDMCQSGVVIPSLSIKSVLILVEFFCYGCSRNFFSLRSV